MILVDFLVNLLLLIVNKNLKSVAKSSLIVLNSCETICFPTLFCSKFNRIPKELNKINLFLSFLKARKDSLLIENDTLQEYFLHYSIAKNAYSFLLSLNNMLRMKPSKCFFVHITMIHKLKCYPSLF